MTWPCSWSTLILLLAVGTGCSGSSGTNPGSETGGTFGSGGTSATGGNQGTGGSSSSGGTVGTGGVTATGGNHGTGGSSSSGGTVGTGGVTATGGAPATGGSVGSGGRAGSGGAAASGGTAGTGQTGGSGVAGQTGSGGGAGNGGSGGAAAMSAGCGKAPTLKNSASNTSFTQNTLTISGKSRQFIIRWPDDYKNTSLYRLIIGLHGATGKGADVAGSSSSEGPYFGLWDLSKGTTIFVAPSADTAFVKEIIKSVEADLCIDTSRIMLEGFSQGAAMSWTLGCNITGVFRAIVGHSGGGVANPSSCQPIAYFGSGGKQENVTQTTQSDQFARWDGCTIETFAAAPTGGHTCNDYKGCSAGHPVRWCPYDGPHTPSPTDSGKTMSWMPSEVWPFFSQF
jgi:poly(3-hydroxybutyrate) depolymerase